MKDGENGTKIECRYNQDGEKILSFYPAEGGWRHWRS